MEPEKGRGSGRRGFALVAVLAVAIGWTIVLAVAEAGRGGGIPSALVRILGSAGILFALFMVWKPREGGVLSLPQVRRVEDEVGGRRGHEPSSADSRVAIVTLTLALALGAVGYRVSHDSYLHQTAAFFIGIPAVLAITLAFTPRAKSATGMIVKGLTLALLLSGVVMGEGLVCILMAAPLFYLVGVAIGVPIDMRRKKKERSGALNSFLGLSLLLMSFEGVGPVTTFPTEIRADVARVVDASPAEVRAALSRAPHFDDELPLYLRLGFPRPVGAEGSGLRVGDRRTILFGSESPMEPMTDGEHDHHVPRSAGGELVFEVAERTRRRVVFEIVSDRTAYTHWVAWERSVVTWRPLDDGSTEVKWSVRFDRKLSPAWYFGPMQGYAARLAAHYLIDTAATP